MLRASHDRLSMALDPQEEPQAVAKAAGLRYVLDTSAGITRKKCGKSFAYFDVQGKPLKDEAHLKRIKALAIPPAWTEVWICPVDSGHLQATGRDVKGRKQYRYHADWNQFRNQNKFSKMQLFAEKLPLIRARVKKDLDQEGMGRDRVLAAIVQIMEQTLIRIGNDEYAEKNNSYGLTTIHNKHVTVKGKKIRFRFKGKSGKFHDVEIEDQRLASIVRKCQELPGQELFAYEAEDGRYVDVGSNDVNQYLQEITGEHITAKDFRTWGGTVRAALTLRDMGPHESKKHLKQMLVRAVEQTAAHLRNTPSICRKYYIHPCVFEAYESGNLFVVSSSCRKSKKSKKSGGLYPEEIFAVKLLEQAEKRTA